MKKSLDEILRRIRIDENGCWIWTGGHTVGYGVARVDGKTVYVHRLVFELVNGYPAQEMVLHKCDVRTCVNPDHLYQGDTSDNMRDFRERNPVRAAEIGRETSIRIKKTKPHLFSTHWSKLPGREQTIAKIPRGEKHHSAKLNQKNVDEIRDRYKRGEKQTDLAACFGVTQANISRVVRGTIWTTTTAPVLPLP